jgi:hypothetical protein
MSVVDEEEHAVGETPKQRASGVTMDYRESRRLSTHVREALFDHIQERRSEAGRLVSIPCRSVNDVGLRLSPDIELEAHKRPRSRSSMLALASLHDIAD